ncbi:MAG TPA: hypothetical protein PK208_03640 [Fibrobacteria bacterium]|nr:hypothetical protein [Fibrobacteria bacterium]
MKSLLLPGILGFCLLQACAGTSPACRLAAKGDLPCQNLNGEAFQACQVEVRRARMTCQTEQMHKTPDTTGFYRTSMR